MLPRPSVRDHGPPLPRANSSFVPAFNPRFSYPTDPTGVFDLEYFFLFLNVQLFRREEGVKGGDFGASRRCLGTI